MINAKKYRKTVEWERLEISSRKLEIPRELWTEVHDTTGDRDQDHPQEKEMQKKQNGCLGRPYK